MKKLLMFIAAALLPITLLAQQPQPAEVTSQQLVDWMRSLNTLEMRYRRANQRFATAEELTRFAEAEERGLSLPNAAELGPYTLQLTLSSDRTRYQATIKRPSDMHDKTTWCKTAVFSDDSGLIFLGKNIGCPQEPGRTTSAKP